MTVKMDPEKFSPKQETKNEKRSKLRFAASKD
jgi:hypothetical protein